MPHAPDASFATPVSIPLMRDTVRTVPSTWFHSIAVLASVSHAALEQNHPLIARFALNAPLDPSLLMMEHANLALLVNTQHSLELPSATFAAAVVRVTPHAPDAVFAMQEHTLQTTANANRAWVTHSRALPEPVSASNAVQDTKPTINTLAATSVALERILMAPAHVRHVPSDPSLTPMELQSVSHALLEHNPTQQETDVFFAMPERSLPTESSVRLVPLLVSLQRTVPRCAILATAVMRPTASALSASLAMPVNIQTKMVNAKSVPLEQ